MKNGRKSALLKMPSKVRKTTTCISLDVFFHSLIQRSYENYAEDNEDNNNNNKKKVMSEYGGGSFAPSTY
jgi:hypothetical protein